MFRLNQTVARSSVFSRRGILYTPKLWSSTKASTATTVPASKTLSDANVLSYQAPNRELKWSAHQEPRSAAMVGPRFEQTNLAAQVLSTRLFQSLILLCIHVGLETVFFFFFFFFFIF